MNDASKAEEHLRVIRSMMERAPVYRAIAGPTALVGGLLSLALSPWILLANPARLKLVGAARFFIVLWLFVLLITLATNALFIWQKAKREGTGLITPGLRLAIRSTLPIILVAGILTFLFWRADETVEALPLLVVIWIISHGLALLATSWFAPRSLTLLGWVFLATGVVFLIWMGPVFSDEPTSGVAMAMGLTFGFYNLFYAALTWPRRTRRWSLPASLRP
jgi:hypothetical protein